jgi:galacturan 1,4-alpha-galacturonidase
MGRAPQLILMKTCTVICNPDNVQTELARFYSSFKRDVRICNSPNCRHLKFPSIKVKNIAISSPAGRQPQHDSSNISCGIYLFDFLVTQQRKPDPRGDDCVSIETGCSNTHMKNKSWRKIIRYVNS